MDTSIHVLSEKIVNYIAAGEVVERPAAVVKELVENAIDAGASQVWVDLEEGGKKLIALRDDGCGMMAEDAVLSVRRHATSKIQTAQDLDSITSLGFRGEALAAIAGVSHFELRTCADEAAIGVCVKVDGGGAVSTEVAALPKGCLVQVHELFYNLPARRKFLRSATTELRHIQQMLVQLALAHASMHLHLQHNGRQIWDWPPAANLQERTHQVFGRAMAAQMLAVQGEDTHFQYNAMLSHPSYSKSNRRWQHLFVNRRPVTDSRIAFAVQQAYRTIIMSGKYPAWVMMLSLPSAEVDVNVHPTKAEVRLRNPQHIYAVLSTRLYQQLNTLTRTEALAGDTIPRASQKVLERGTALASNWSTSQFPPLAGDPFAEPELAKLTTSSAENTMDSTAADNPQPASAQTSAPMPASPLPQAEGFHFQPLVSTDETPAAQQHFLAKTPTVLSQFDRTYIVAQHERSLLLIDQHAAHERILFEHYRNQFYGSQIVTETLLVPFSLELSPQNVLLLEQYLPQWRKMGFEMECFGRHTFLVRQVPALLKGKDIERLVLDVLDELALFGKSGRLEEVFNEILQLVACHAAMRAGDTLTTEVMQELLGRLCRLDISLYCPHGRPVWVELAPHELERRFRRKV